MEAKELMIGDWVYAKVQVDDTGTEPVYETIPKRVSELSRGINGIYAEDTSTFAGAEILPIPLTPEILEKNGLNKGTWGCSDRVCYSIIDGAYQLALVQELPSYYCNIRTVSSLVNMNIPIRYVHELQHALRLAGINKEIVL